MISRAIEKFFRDKEKRGWDKGYFVFDIHGTILKPNYTYGSTPSDFYPMAMETLRLISKLDDVVMILYTCSHPHEIDEYLQLFDGCQIYFKYVNKNPEVKTDMKGYGNYDTKPYMNVLFEDKAGFNPETDWQEVYDLLIEHYGEIK